MKELGLFLREVCVYASDFFWTSDTVAKRYSR